MGGAPEEMASFKVFDEEKTAQDVLKRRTFRRNGCLGSRQVEEAARNSRVPKLLMPYSIG